MNSLGNWLAKITKFGKEDGSFPIQQFEMNGRVGDAYIVSPYGVHANLPEGQPALNLSPDGTILLGIDPVGRIKVENGEVVFYHPKTRSSTLYKNNGEIIMTAPKIKINGNLEVSGTISGAGITDTNNNVTLGTHTHNGGLVPSPDAGS